MIKNSFNIEKIIPLFKHFRIAFLHTFLIEKKNLFHFLFIYIFIINLMKLNLNSPP